MIKKLVGLSVLALTVSIATSLPADASNRTRVCKPATVGVFSNRIHVRCESINGQGYTEDIKYYAMKLDDSPQVQATLQLLLMAKANNRELSINFDESDYNSIPGCQGSNCRRLRWASMR
ncbi:MAG: hypothetical protein AAGJ68_00745 [Pseudomonadota bacterium]